uniref:EF-hand calcium binding domain 3 n=1 Tax=Salvator merianae TaxID=96440 RepID=A0A8D0BPH0_SALMN
MTVGRPMQCARAIRSARSGPFAQLCMHSQCIALPWLLQHQRAFRDAYNTFSKDLEGNIDLPALEATAQTLGISLTEEEAFDELAYADTDGDGKVNFTDFLNIITDNKRFIQAVGEKKDNSCCFLMDSPGILFFELLSKLVETAVLPRKTTTTIVSYYRQKFLESTSKKAWLSDSFTDGKRRSKTEGLKKSKSTSAAAYTGVARICVMKDKDLQAYVEQLRAHTAPSDSPYSQVPIFPLIPNRDGMISGKPKKDIHKLEALRRMEPVSSFEDHFFHKNRWIKQEVREVKKVTDNYKKAIALRERNKSLKLWRRLRGAEIGVDTGNPSFYQTFSTYTWSWNVCQELLTPRELQQYDREHPSTCQPSMPTDKYGRAAGSQKQSKK